MNIKSFLQEFANQRKQGRNPPKFVKLRTTTLIFGFLLLSGIFLLPNIIIITLHLSLC